MNNSQQMLGGRSYARLQQAKERLGRGVVGFLPRVGLCLHNGGTYLEVGGITVIDCRRPLIGLEASEPEMLRACGPYVDPQANAVAKAINQTWHGFNLATIRADTERLRMAQHN